MPTPDLPPADLPAWQHTKKHQRAVRDALINRRETGHVLRELKAERARQDARWGQQDHPDLTGVADVPWFHQKAEESRQRAERHARNGTLAWDHIMQEEWDEARLEAAEGNPYRLRQELIQVMAVAGAWVEALDRREVARVNAETGNTPDAVETVHTPDACCTEGRCHFTPCVQVPGLPNVYVRQEVLEHQDVRLADWERELIDTTSDTDAAGHAGMHSSMPGRSHGPSSPWVTPRNDGEPHDLGCRWTFSAHPAGCLDDPNGDYSDPEPVDTAEEPPSLVRFVQEKLGVELTPWQAACLRSWEVTGVDATEPIELTTARRLSDPEPTAEDPAERVITVYGSTPEMRRRLGNMGYTVKEYPERGKAQGYVFADGSAPSPADIQWAEGGRALGAAGQPVSSYSGGGVRDVTEGKPRIDLMWPLGVPFEAQMLTRVGVWLERGMRKYAERNWERFHTPDALVHALASLGRHYGEYMTNEATRANCENCQYPPEDANGNPCEPGTHCTCYEDHAAAIITNVIFAETIRWKIDNNWTPEGTFGS